MQAAADIHPELNQITSSLFRVSAKLLVIQNEKILVVHEKEGWFGLPGGGVDHGEPVLETLIREISEEISTNVVAAHISPLPIAVDSTATFDGIPRATLLYEYTADEPLQPKNLELTFRWVSADEYAQLLLAPNIVPLRDVILQKARRHDHFAG